MARGIDDATSDGFVANSNIADNPYSMACRMWAIELTENDPYLSIADENDGSVRNLLRCKGDTAGDLAEMFTRLTSGTNGTAKSTGSITTKWMHIAGVCASTSSRAVYLDGSGDKGTETTTVNNGGTWDKLGIGQTSHQAGTGIVEGYIGDAAWWSVALDDDEVDALADGYCPLLVDAANLQHYFPLGGLFTDDDYDLIIGEVGTGQSGSETSEEHPNVIYPEDGQLVYEEYPEAGAGITRGATISNGSRTVSGTDASVSHTVDTGTTLLVVTTMYEAGETVSGTPQWSLGGGENLTLVDETTRSGSNNDMCISTYALVNPTAGTGTVTVTHTNNDNYITTAVNYIGTNTSGTMSENIALLSEDVNDTASNTSVFASGGTAGNTLYAAGGFKGGDGDGITVPTNFFEVFDGQSGSNANSDIAGYVCDNLDGAPDSCTWTWAVTDENAGHMLEIFLPAGGDVERTLSDSVEVADNDFRNLSMMKLSAADLNDAITFIKDGFTFDTVAIGPDVMFRVIQAFRYGGVDVTDLSSKQKLGVLSNNIEVSDYSDIITGIYRFYSDSISVADALNSSILVEVFRQYVETVGVTDANTKGVQKFFVESGIVLTDSLVKTLDKIFLDTITTSDTLSSAIIVEIFRQYVESIGVSDDTVKRVEALLSDPITITDATVKDLEKILGESVTVSDSLLSSIASEVVRLLTDSISVTDSRFTTLNKILNDAEVITDATTKDLRKSLAEALEVNDSLLSSLIVEIFRLYADSIGVADNRVKDILKFTLDNVDITDALLSQIAAVATVIVRALEDSVDVTDEVVKEKIAIIANSVVVTTSLIKDLSKVLSSQVDVTDEVMIQQMLDRVLNDTLDLEDDLVRTLVEFTFGSLVSLIAQVLSAEVSAEVVPAENVKVGIESINATADLKRM